MSDDQDYTLVSLESHESIHGDSGPVSFRLRETEVTLLDDPCVRELFPNRRSGKWERGGTSFVGESILENLST